jgi:hypothetical protein
MLIDAKSATSRRGGEMKRILTVLMGVLLATGITVVAPTVAQAAKSDCASGKLCMWHNQNYTSTRFDRTSSDDHLNDDSDEAHSVYNFTGVAWVLYDDNTYDESDRHFCIKAKVSHPDLGVGAYKFGDKITSVKKLGSNSCAGYPTITQG